MIYFDNASTSWPKPKEVLDFVDSFLRSCGGSALRGSYSGAMTAARLIDETRARLRYVLHCPAKQVIFTPSATIAMNEVLQGLIKYGAKVFYVSPFEHNAVMRTLNHFKQQGEIDIIELVCKDGPVWDFDAIAKQFKEKLPDAVVLNHASNVFGFVSPAEKLFSLAKEYSAITVLDMAQTAGVVDFDAGNEDIDFAIFAGHKTLLGIAGVGGFVMKASFDLPPTLFGGTGIDSSSMDMGNAPAKYEPGTACIAAIAGLYASLEWILKQGVASLQKADAQKRKKLLSVLQSRDFLHIIDGDGGNNCERVGIVSVLFDSAIGIDANDAAILFDERGVDVRCGLQCAPVAHRFMNTLPSGTVRFSVGALTTDKDIDTLSSILDNIGREL